MLEIWIYTLAAVLIVSLVSLMGILTVMFKQKYLKGFLLLMVSFAAGTMLGDVFLHLVPELLHQGSFTTKIGLNILIGILLFFVLEKVVHWRHCHMPETKDHVHSLAIMNLIGDAIHNFIDGILIAGSFMLSIPVGIATTIAVLFHEIPQEMGDFGVLVHAGLKVRKALFLNFITALSSFLGVLLVLGIGIEAETVIEFIIPITIGGFLYIANADLIPELHKDVKVINSIAQLISIIFGIALMVGLLYLPISHSHEEGGPHQETGNIEIQELNSVK